MNFMKMIPVSSSNLSAVGYDSSTHVLYVSFHSGSMYAYNGVPQEIYNGLMAAPSKGKYHAAYIKNSFAYRRIA